MHIGDIDIFFTCSLEEASGLLPKIYDLARQPQTLELQQVQKLVVSRSKHAVTIFRVYEGKLFGPPIQIILSVYSNVAHLLSSFDLDSCAVAYVPASKGVYCTPRALRAIRYSVNIFDSDLEGVRFW